MGSFTFKANSWVLSIFGLGLGYRSRFGGGTNNWANRYLKHSVGCPTADRTCHNEVTRRKPGCKNRWSSYCNTIPPLGACTCADGCWSRQTSPAVQREFCGWSITTNASIESNFRSTALRTPFSKPCILQRSPRIVQLSIHPEHQFFSRAPGHLYASMIFSRHMSLHTMYQDVRLGLRSLHRMLILTT